MNPTSSTEEQFRVIIAGGGVAALEAALALRELGGERIATTMLAPNPEFVYLPMTVREPFGYAAAAVSARSDCAGHRRRATGRQLQVAGRRKPRRTHRGGQGTLV